MQNYLWWHALAVVYTASYCHYPQEIAVIAAKTAVGVNVSRKHQLQSIMGNPCENPERGWRSLTTIIPNIFVLFIHFQFLSFSSFFFIFRVPFFVIGTDEDGDFITGLLWIITWCNWPSCPIGGALLQLEEAPLAQVEALIQLRSGFHLAVVPFI